MPAVLGYGAFTSILLAAFEYTGASLKGKKPEIEGMDEFERKQHLRTNRRRPLEETLAEVGEGRGNVLLILPRLDTLTDTAKVFNHQVTRSGAERD